MTKSRQRTLGLMRVLSAFFLTATGGIHLFLVVDGIGSLVGVTFILNGIAGILLAIGVLVLRGVLFTISAVLGLLFLVASLAALLLALTIGFFGITEVWSFTLVPETVVIEAIGIVVLAITSALTFQRPRAA